MTTTAQRGAEKASTTIPLYGHKDKVHSLGWNESGTILASASIDKTVRLWSFSQGSSRSLSTLKGHKASVDYLCWNPKSDHSLATASSDKTVRIWDTKSGHCIKSIPTSGENINIKWHPSGKIIAVGDTDDTASFIDTRTNRILFKYQFENEVNEIAWSAAGDYFLASGAGSSRSGQITMFKFNTGSWSLNIKSKYVLKGHLGSAFTMDFDPTGRYMASGAADAVLAIWELGSLTCVRSISRFDYPVRTISFSSDGSLIAAGSEHDWIDIADVETGDLVYRLDLKRIRSAGFSVINTVKFHPKEEVLAFAGEDKDHEGYLGAVHLLCSVPRKSENEEIGGGGGGGGSVVSGISSAFT